MTLVRVTAATLGGMLALAPLAAASAQEPEQPTVGIAMAHDGGEPEPGEPITYTVAVVNDSAVAAAGYQVTTALPDGVGEVVWTCAAHGTGSACGADTGTGDLADTADLGAGGGVVVYSLFATVDPEFTGVSLTAAAGLTPPPGGGCDPCRAGTTIGPVPTVVLTKTYQPRDADLTPGGPITITVTLANDSPADATGYAVEGLLPDEVIDVTWTCTATGAGSACGTGTGAGDLRDTADIGAGGSVVYLLTGRISPQTTGEFVQAVTLVPGPGQACEPVHTRSRFDLDGTAATGYGYAAPQFGEEMTCRVNNRPRPQLPPAPESGDSEGTGAPADETWTSLPNTGAGTAAYLAAGAAAIAAGTLLVLLVPRRRPQPGSASRAR